MGLAVRIQAHRICGSLFLASVASLYWPAEVMICTSAQYQIRQEVTLQPWGKVAVASIDMRKQVYGSATRVSESRLSFGQLLNSQSFDTLINIASSRRRACTYSDMYQDSIVISSVKARLLLYHCM
jgi:hypothetical protein